MQYPKQISLIGLLVTLLGCGQTGPLYLPKVPATPLPGAPTQPNPHKTRTTDNLATAATDNNATPTSADPSWKD